MCVLFLALCVNVSSQSRRESSKYSASDKNYTNFLVLVGEQGVRSWSDVDVSGELFVTAPGMKRASTVSFRLMDKENTHREIASVPFEYYDEPVVTSVKPYFGSMSGGSIVHLYGSGFSGSAVECRFGIMVASGANARIISSTAVACVSPASSLAGSVSIEISLNGGVDVTSNDVQFEYGPSAAVTSVIPSRAKSGRTGQMVTIV
jgi:hypothetical protein